MVRRDMTATFLLYRLNALLCFLVLLGDGNANFSNVAHRSQRDARGRGIFVPRNDIE